MYRIFFSKWTPQHLWAIHRQEESNGNLAVTSNPKSFSPTATLDPRPRLWTRDRDFGPATATLDPRPRHWTHDRDLWTRDPRLLVKLDINWLERVRNGVFPQHIYDVTDDVILQRSICIISYQHENVPMLWCSPVPEGTKFSKTRPDNT